MFHGLTSDYIWMTDEFYVLFPNMYFLFFLNEYILLVSLKITGVIIQKAKQFKSSKILVSDLHCPSLQDCFLLTT